MSFKEWFVYFLVTEVTQNRDHGKEEEFHTRILSEGKFRTLLFPEMFVFRKRYILVDNFKKDKNQLRRITDIKA